METRKTALSYNQLKVIYRSILKYPKEIRNQFFEESIRLNGYNIFEPFIKSDEQERKKADRELQKGYMKLLSN